MAYHDYFRQPTEDSDAAFARLLSQYEGLIVKTVKIFRDKYERHLYSYEVDKEDLLQMARTALWQADRRFSLERVAPGVNPDYYFSAFAQKTIRGTLSDYLRKLAKRDEREQLSLTETPLDAIDPFPEPIEKQMQAVLEEYLPLMPPRERLYIEEGVLKGWETAYIATIHHVSINTVGSWKKAVRRRLQPLRCALHNH
ncbi:MAG: sigma-70 family RNA polymerase sigma factor [Sporolactobacillus sp.]